MSPASSQIPRLHTRKHHLGPCFSCASVCICVGRVICVQKSVMCISQCNRDCVIYIYECVFIRLCVLLDVFILLATLGWMVRLTDSDAHLCVSRFPGVSFAPCFVLCVCVCACLFTYSPPGQIFPDELCLWQVVSFAKSDTHRTKSTFSTRSICGLQ